MEEIDKQTINQQSLTPRSVPLHLLRLALPMIISMISRTVMSFVDFVMVSRLGTEAQAAVLPAGITLYCVSGFGIGLMTAVNTFVSQSLGRQRLSDCSAYAWQGLYLSLLAGAGLMPFWFFVPSFFTWVGHAESVRQMEIIYTQIGILSVGPAIVANGLSNFFNGIHRPGVSTIAAVSGNVFNLVANYALIFGHFGFQPMGIAGAAWATLAASLLQMGSLFVFMMLPRTNSIYSCWQTWRPDVRRIGALIRVGLPTAMQYVVDIGAWTIFILFLVGRFGTVHLAASNLCFKLLELSFMPTVGLGVATTSAVGNAIGQGRFDLARAIVRWSILFAGVYMGLIGTMYLIIPYHLIQPLTSDPQVTSIARIVLIFCAIFQVFDAFGIVYSSALRGAGDTFWPAVLSASYALTVFLGAGFAVAILVPQWQSFGPWAAGTAYIAFYGASMFARFSLGRWEHVKLEPEPQ